MPSESPISRIVQRPITVSGGSVVEVDVTLDVDVVDVEEGMGAPVENRQPAPGGLNASMLTNGGGRFLDGPDGGVVVDDAEVPSLVVGPDVVVVAVVRTVVVGSAAVEW